jgi:hypothetical protein
LEAVGNLTDVTEMPISPTVPGHEEEAHIGTRGPDAPLTRRLIGARTDVRWALVDRHRNAPFRSGQSVPRERRPHGCLGHEELRGIIQGGGQAVASTGWPPRRRRRAGVPDALASCSAQRAPEGTVHGGGHPKGHRHQRRARCL